MAPSLLNMPFGPKEGRESPVPIFASVSADRRRRFSSRQRNLFVFGVILLVFLIYSIFFRLHIPAHSGSLRGVSQNNPASPYKGPDKPLRFDSQKRVWASDPQQPIVDKDGGKLEDPSKEPAAERTAKQKVQYYTGQQHNGRWPDRKGFKRDLDAIITLLPDEITTREYLRPISDGGPERMRELGLRTRAYKKYLDAWEKLHLVEDVETGEMSVRDDIIQYMRGMEGNEPGPVLINMIHKYEAYRSFVTQFARVLFPFTGPYFADHMTLHAGFKRGGRGIVLTAGDDQAKYLMTTISSFRKLGCDLPIEIMYLGDGDLGEDHRLELETLPDVTTRDISTMVDDEGWTLAGWAIKPFAMLMSSFREVIFIDADSLFFRDPAKLFQDPDYKETGALFFRDRTIMPESKRRWLLQILPRPIPQLAKESTWWKGTSGHHQESGVVVVDKWKHFVSMLLICRFNGSDRDQRDDKVGVYEMMHGDKETFWIAFLLADDPGFAFHRGLVGSMGVVEVPPSPGSETKPESSTSGSDVITPANLPSEIVKSRPADTRTICSPQLLHLDVDGTPLWFNGWLLESKYAEAGKRKFAPMKSYMAEPQKHLFDDDFWKLSEDNLCCLTSDQGSLHDLDEEDLGLLTMMRDRAAEVGSMTEKE
ncbi:glycosyltransferase family 71 protein [Astrocystis sublimbata]|nr:glycosyltransferase family 71 protein [Astrocystis sublimbata]